ncbi:Integrator complex subunit 4-like protein [Smittium culicis]|uniref:Integrator complex subunit 4-like protein n=1 Tax=Smittium culicis TaxID=133412 RepID=A0A1R1Y0V4_9FUNG|nr:Integrator complex subunit 4-like protein [Smittium culicis]
MSHLKRPVNRKKNNVDNRNDKNFVKSRFQQNYLKTHIPIPGGDFDGGVYSEEFHILDSGAAGAFVHGLEDEFQEVRNASIGII